MTDFNYKDSVALVTGASRGIGAAIARELVQRGIAALVLTARSADDLDSLANELRTLRPELRVETITADLTDPAAPGTLKSETDRLGLAVDILVNNAGFGSFGPFDSLDPEKEADMVGVNVSALVALTRHYLPGMLDRGRGGVLNVGSTAGFQPVPYMATYGATKAFVQSFSEALWAENADLENDVRIVCLCPGGTETNFGHAIGVPRSTFEKAPHTTPEEVAVAGLDALNRNDLYVVVGEVNYVGTLLPRLLPRATTARFAGEIFRPEGRPANRKTGNTAGIVGALIGAVVVAGLTFGLTRARAASDAG